MCLLPLALCLNAKVRVREQYVMEASIALRVAVMTQVGRLRL